MKRSNPNIPNCDQCQMLNINGINCHETGCPNSRKTWVPERGWALFVECRVCGSEGEAGEYCDCQDSNPEPDDEAKDDDEAEDPKPDNYVDLGGCCDDCLIAINNDDYSGMDDATEARVRAGMKRVGQWLLTGKELGFCHSRCAVCGGLPGDRHEIGYLQEETK